MKTNETDGATPRPWTQNNGNIRGKWETGQLVGIAIVGTTSFCGDECGGPSDLRMRAEDRANAALIVQAVNSYEALLAVAEAAQQWRDQEKASVQMIDALTNLAAIRKSTKDSVDKKQSTE